VVQALGHHDLDLLHQLLAVAAGTAHRRREDAIAHGVERAEGKILELVLEGVDAEAVGDGREDVEGLARDAVALVRRHHPERAHVVKAIGQLDEHDADVVDHRQHHLLQVGRLLLGARIEVQMGELAQAVDEARDRLAEFLLDVHPRDVGVFQHIVQQRGHDAVAVEREFGHRAGDRQGMGDVGLAGEALLALVGLGAEGVGPLDAPQGARVQAPLQIRAEIVDGVASRRRRRLTGECLVGHASNAATAWRIAPMARSPQRRTHSRMPEPAWGRWRWLRGDCSPGSLLPRRSG
jgi:hypothetical protein